MPILTTETTEPTEPKLTMKPQRELSAQVKQLLHNTRMSDEDIERA
ncbi:MAG: hypothetical protein ABR867_05810 [Nitrososphaerales archaeon]